MNYFQFSPEFQDNLSAITIQELSLSRIISCNAKNATKTDNISKKQQTFWHNKPCFSFVKLNSICRFSFIKNADKIKCRTNTAAIVGISRACVVFQARTSRESHSSIITTKSSAYFNRQEHFCCLPVCCLLNLIIWFYALKFPARRYRSS